MKKTSLIGLSIIMIFVISLFMILSCKKKNPTGPSTSRITCDAGCSSMSWGINGESGTRTSNSNCSRSYTASGDYVETCTGTMNYSSSGKTYNYSATYDWPNCAISVTVTGVGSCSDNAGTSKTSLSKLNDECHCEDLSINDMIVKFKNK